MSDAGRAVQAGADLAVGMAQVGLGFAGLAFEKQQYRDAKRREQGLKREMEDIENSREDVINPYEGVEDLSGMISNPYDNLSVATQAAEMQAEEADISLANTLDTLRATGASAGGATALAQAALQSKKDIAASIEKQEVANEKFRAQGEAKATAARIAEAQRLQQADVLGREFVYGEEERRDVEQLNRLTSLITGQQQAQVAARQGVAALTGSTIEALQDFGSTLGQTDFSAFSKNPPPGTNTTAASDVRLKKNIKLIGKSPSGLNIYSFEYIDKKYGKHKYQGVMSNEIDSQAVIKHQDGYDRVDYSKLDVEFKRI